MTADDPRIAGVEATIEWLRPWVESFGPTIMGFEAHNLLRELEAWLESIEKGDSGYAVVELPKPDEPGVFRVEGRSIWLDARGPGGVRTLGDTWVADPRATGAAFLAAAEAAEARKKGEEHA